MRVKNRFKSRVRTKEEVIEPAKAGNAFWQEIGNGFKKEKVDTANEKYKDTKFTIKRLSLTVAKEAPYVVINPYTTQSFWSWERNFINVGLLEFFHEAVDIDFQKLAELLFYHEVSHENHTEIPQEKKLPYPFHLLNILEDERIERLAQKKWSVNFAPLHRASYECFYVYGKAPKAHPINFIVLKRWARWSRYIEKDIAYLEEEFPEEFVDDVEKVLDDATKSKTTEEMLENTRWFWEKWKKELSLWDEEQVQMGIGHGNSGDVDAEKSEEKMSEEAKDFIDREKEKDKKREWGRLNNDIDEIGFRYSNYFSKEPEWEIDKKTVKRLERIVSKIVFKTSQLVKENTMLGKRPDPRKLENCLPNPFKRKSEKTKMKAPKILFVIDGSGSMAGEEYEGAIHLAVAFMETVPGVKVVITLDCGEFWEVRSVKDLLHYKCNGGTEKLRSVAKEMQNYDLTVFFTDACVSEEDEKFLEKIKNKRVVGMLTTFDSRSGQQWLEEHFKRAIVASNIEEATKGLAKIVKKLF